MKQFLIKQLEVPIWQRKEKNYILLFLHDQSYMLSKLSTL